MTNREAIRLIRNLPTMCEFTDAYGEPIDSDAYYEALDMAISALESQDIPDTIAGDMISRRGAYFALVEKGQASRRYKLGETWELNGKEIREALEALQPAQPTLCGYDINHLMIIAEVLRKENLPPERVAEAVTDIGLIVSIVRAEFDETLRKAVEQCKI